MSKKSTKKQEQKNNIDLLSKLDNFFKKNEKLLFVLSVLLTLTFVTFLFNPLVSVGGDDSTYIIKAFRFAKNFDFPTYQGPLYPIFLSPFILIFGLNIVLLKFLSVLFIIGHLYFFHITFKDKIPAIVHAFTLLILSICSSYIYFAYQTYVEAFFLLIQSVAVWYFMQYFIQYEADNFNLKRDYKRYLMLGFMILLMGLTRTIGYAMFFVIILYFIVYKKWYALIPATGSFGIIYGLYTIIKKLVWGLSGADFASQSSGLLNKSFYYPVEGKEDLAGFFQRLIDNSNLYLSKHLYVFLGLRDFEPVMKVIPWLTVLTYILFAVTIILVVSRNKQIFFTSAYAGILCFITFIIIQKTWDQDRLIIPYFPMIVLSLSGGLYYLFKRKKFVKFQFLLPGLFLWILFSSLQITTDKAKDHSELKRPWYDLTPDWINFIKCSQWADNNLPGDVKIASRKPSISFVYSKGREFVGIYNFKTFDTELIFNTLEDSTYIIAAYNDVFGKEIPPQLQSYLRFNTSFILIYDDALIGIYKPQTQFIQSILNIFDKASVEYSMSPSRYFSDNNLSSIDNYTVSPDSLLAVFQEHDVDYVIDASLRINPYAKTERIINTVLRHITFIEQKYPGIFEKIIQIGDDNNEPAYVYRIKYELYGLEK